MENRPLRAAAIHDLSSFGRCSLSVIIPVLSAMGIQACPIPTAVLSTHTGGLGEVEFRDLTDFISPCLAHYQRLELDFECIYTGFLGSAEQVDHCLQFFKTYPHALAVVDPVMGDHGKPYKTCTKNMQRRMLELVHCADVITPNLTEAYMLLGREYSHTPITRIDARSMLAKLSELGPKSVVVTGVELMTGEMANIGYDRANNAYWYVGCDYVPASYPGTGDIFAGVLTGAFLSGDSLPIAINRATQFIELAIKTTFSYASDPRHGVMLERVLEWLTRKNVLCGYHIL